MNKVLIPVVTFAPVIADKSRIAMAYSRIFEIARRNILARRNLTKGVSQNYTKVQYGKKVSDN